MKENQQPDSPNPKGSPVSLYTGGRSYKPGKRSLKRERGYSRNSLRSKNRQQRRRDSLQRAATAALDNSPYRGVPMLDCISAPENTRDRFKFREYASLVESLKKTGSVPWDKLDPLYNQQSPLLTSSLTPSAMWFLICSSYFPRQMVSSSWQTVLSDRVSQLERMRNVVELKVSPSYSNRSAPEGADQSEEEQSSFDSGPEGRLPFQEARNLIDEQFRLIAFRDNGALSLNHLGYVSGTNRQSEVYIKKYEQKHDIFLNVCRNGLIDIYQEQYSNFWEQEKKRPGEVMGELKSMELDMLVKKWMVEHQKGVDLFRTLDTESDFIKLLELKKRQHLLKSSQQEVEIQEVKEKGRGKAGRPSARQSPTKKGSQRPQKPEGSCYTFRNGYVAGDIPNEAYICQVCDEGDYQDDNLIVFCSRCSITVHQKCSGLLELPTTEWVCQVCYQFEERGKLVSCLFCSRRGGAMVRTDILRSDPRVAIINPKYASKKVNFVEREDPRIEESGKQSKKNLGRQVRGGGRISRISNFSNGPSSSSKQQQQSSKSNKKSNGVHHTSNSDSSSSKNQDSLSPSKNKKSRSPPPKEKITLPSIGFGIGLGNTIKNRIRASALSKEKAQDKVTENTDQETSKPPSSKMNQDFEKKLHYNHFRQTEYFSRYELLNEPVSKHCWAHLTCGYWIPGLKFVSSPPGQGGSQPRRSSKSSPSKSRSKKKKSSPKSQAPRGLKGTVFQPYISIPFRSLNMDRSVVPCQVCKYKKKGLVVQCPDRGCRRAFHPECARRANVQLSFRYNKAPFWRIYCAEHSELPLKKHLDQKRNREGQEISRFCRAMEKYASANAEEEQALKSSVKSSRFSRRGYNKKQVKEFDLKVLYLVEYYRAQQKRGEIIWNLQKDQEEEGSYTLLDLEPSKIFEKEKQEEENYLEGDDNFKEEIKVKMRKSRGKIQLVSLTPPGKKSKSKSERVEPTYKRNGYQQILFPEEELSMNGRTPSEIDCEEVNMQQERERDGEEAEAFMGGGESPEGEVYTVRSTNDLDNTSVLEITEVSSSLMSGSQKGSIGKRSALSQVGGPPPKKRLSGDLLVPGPSRNKMKGYHPGGRNSKAFKHLLQASLKQ